MTGVHRQRSFHMIIYRKKGERADCSWRANQHDADGVQISMIKDKASVGWCDPGQVESRSVALHNISCSGHSWSPSLQEDRRVWWLLIATFDIQSKENPSMSIHKITKSDGEKRLCGSFQVRKKVRHDLLTCRSHTNCYSFDTIIDDAVYLLQRKLCPVISILVD